VPQLHLAFLGYAAVLILVYWLLPARLQNIFLAAASSAFLIFLDAISFLVLTTLIVFAFAYSRRPQSRLFGVCLAAPLLLFCGIRTLQMLNRSGYAVSIMVLTGFGFYALKLIHYVVESRAGTFRTHRFLDFFNYMIFFPTILIGPIHLFDTFLKSQRRVQWNEQTFASGLERILYGYGKVIILANWLVATRFDSIVQKLEPGALSVLAQSVVHGFNLYFAFAGYSDIAIGLALLLGFNVGENFNHPFLKANIGEFWQSWHMSLSAWCRKYVFLPMYAQWRMMSIALIGTMLAIALWHEFSLRFFLWGIYHGAGILIWRTYQKFAKPYLTSMHGRAWRVFGRAVSILGTFLFVMVGFTIPRSDSFQEIIQNFQTLFGF
jgi:alginate O-acetyltransferase complex protein AlgI